MTGSRGTGAERRGAGDWDSVLEKESHLVAPGEEWRTELWAVAVAHFERAADLLDLIRTSVDAYASHAGRSSSTCRFAGTRARSRSSPATGCSTR